MRFRHKECEESLERRLTTAVAREIAEYKLDLVRVQELRWDRGGTEPAGDYTFFYGKGNDIHELDTGFVYIYRIISAVMRLDFVSGTMSYIILRCS
jgi:hypothetical protein